MKHQYVYSILLFVLSFLLILTYSYSGKINLLESKLETGKDVINLLMNNINESFRFELTGSFLDLSIEDENGNKTTLNQICDKDSTFIFLSTEYTCGECIDAQLGVLKECKMDKEIILIMSGLNNREISIFKRVNKIKDDVYTCDYKSEFFSIEFDSPLIILVNKGCIVQRVFRPIKYFPELTKNFISQSY